jgi:serine/threonine protein kinase
MPDVQKTVGRYEILREVGRGGMARVYLARQSDLDRFVALKELAAFHASDPAFAQRFLRESRVAGSLSHPNIVTVHDYFEHDGTPYIAMEYVDRGSLRGYVGRMSLAQVSGVLEGLLAGLAHAEQQGIVHRDLKPENLMVTSDGRVKIADFGIAKATTKMQTGAFLTATGTTVGTPTYMAPEQAMAQDIGPWTDLYSVGCMAFELFTGRVPFHDSDAPMAILLRHVNEPIPPVKSIEPSVDQGISDWIERLLVKDPKLRAQSATAAWDDFEELVIGILGPRWRREARLMEDVAQADTPKPLTPAPFEGTSADPAVSDEFQSFEWGSPGPYTPPPSDAVEPADEATGFETYVAPGPPRPPEPPPPEPVVQAPEPEPEPEPEVAATVAPVVAPEPEAAPEPEPARRNWLPLAIGAGIVVAAILGFVLGGSGGDETATGGGAPAVVMSNAAMKLKVPEGWAKAAAPKVPGLTLAEPVAASGDGATAAFGLVHGDADNSTLLPAGLIQAAGAVPKDRDAVALGPDRLQAYRYRNVKLSGLDGAVTLYAVPTAQGVATLACLPACETVADTLQLNGAEAFPVGPSPAYAKAVGSRLSALSKATAKQNATLAKAKTPTAQAAAARKLQAAHRTAAARLPKNQQLSPADRGANARLRAALGGVAKAYGQAATAAAKNDKGGFKQAGAAVTRAQRELAGAMAGLRAAGYEIES